RYAGDPEYLPLLADGLARYPDDPMLLYLTGERWHGAHDDSTGRRYLERAAAADPSFLEPWFSLVSHYMDQEDDEKLGQALRHLLDGDAIQAEVMEYSYNMLAGLAKNAILITNGDNDTYPGWIYTRLLDFRPDVILVNRSLLNTDWYPAYLQRHGLPEFITPDELSVLRREPRPDFHPASGPFGDMLIERLVQAATRAARPVYLSWTLAPTESLERLWAAGRVLGLVTLVTPPTREYRDDLAPVLEAWLHDFRTRGLQDWRLRQARPEDAGRRIVTNYAGALARTQEAIRRHTPEYEDDLFEWLQQHAIWAVSPEKRDYVIRNWCEESQSEAVQAWCSSQGYKQ
ncbi:MAG: hypothetical protein ABIF77_19930, partial [bacterium]